MTSKGVSTHQDVARNDNQFTDLPSNEAFHEHYLKYTRGLTSVLEQVHPDALENFSRSLTATRRRRGKIIFFGNGGSSATASHAAADFSKQRFEDESLLFRSISLGDNSSTITAIGNDFGYEKVFEQQLKVILEGKDLVVAISSSGNSANILRGVDYANSRGVETWGICGFDGGQLKSRARQWIHIPTKVGQYGFHEDSSMAIIHAVSIYLYEQDLAGIVKRDGMLKDSLTQPVTKVIESPETLS